MQDRPGKVEDAEIWVPPSEIASAALEHLGDLLRHVGYGKPDDARIAGNGAIDRARDLLKALFEQNASIDLTDTAAALGVETPDLLLQSSFVVQHGAQLASRVRIFSWHDLYIAGDLKGADQARDDAVFAVSGTTRTLDALRLDSSAGRAVDLGCGSGALALRLAAKAEHVSATDINPRAVAFTQANSALNRVKNVSVHLGSLYEPLRIETADLILGNLPFVLSPDQRHLYRDGDRPSDKLITDAVLGAADHLAPGGVAQFTCNWPINDTDELAWIRKLASGTGLDLLAIEYRRRTPLDHARTWNQPSGTPDWGAQQALERRWVDWFAAQKVDNICFGVLTLRRPLKDRPGCLEYLRADRQPDVRGDRQVDRMLRAMDRPLTLDSIPVPVPHVVYQQLVHDGSRYTAMPVEFFTAQSAGVALKIQPEALATMISVDGSNSVADIAAPDEAGHAVLQDAYRRGFIDLPADPNP